MMCFVASFLVLAASVAVLVACLAVEVMLALRLWHDIRPSRWYALSGTLWAILLIGGSALLAGIGAFTIAEAAALALSDCFI